MTVLFGQAYFLRFDPKLWAARQPYAPLGTLYAAAAARARGYDVRLFDAMLAGSEAEWAASLDRHRPQVAVLYEDSFNYLSKMCLLRMREAALTMIGAARDRGVPVVVAGSDASDHSSTYLDRGAAVVITGEGEVTLVEVLDAMSGRGSTAVADIPGVAMMSSDGRLVRTRSRDIIRDLDALPRPAWDLVDVNRYRDIWQSRHGYFSMNLVTTRGCPYHCNWCAKPIYGQRYTARSPESVADEIAWLRSTYAPDHLWIVDDIFGLKPGWVDQFADLLVRRGIVTPFKCLVRADGVTGAAAAALQRAGCRTAWIGAESGSQRILDAMEKGTRVDQIADAARRLRERRIDVGFFLQFGYPGETLDDIEATLRMVRESAPDDIGISVSYPLPGTAFYERVKAELGAKQNWVDSNDLAMMYRAAHVPDFYRALHSLVHAEFRARQALSRLTSIGGRGGSLRLRRADTRSAHTVWHDVAAGLYHAVRLPILRRRVARLAREKASPSPMVLRPVLTRQAAAIPTEQPQ